MRGVVGALGSVLLDVRKVLLLLLLFILLLLLFSTTRIRIYNITRVARGRARQAAVDCLVELHLALGEEALGPELRPLLRDEVCDEQRKLVDWYVAKRGARGERAADAAS